MEKYMLEWIKGAEFNHISLEGRHLKENAEQILMSKGECDINFIPFFEGTFEECSQLSDLIKLNKWEEAAKLYLKATYGSEELPEEFKQCKEWYENSKKRKAEKTN